MHAHNVDLQTAQCAHGYYVLYSTRIDFPMHVIDSEICYNIIHYYIAGLRVKKLQANVSCEDTQT